MLKKTLPLLIVLSLAACSQSEAPTAAAPAEAPKPAETAPAPAPAPAEPVKSPIEQAVAGAWRSPENVARDAFRNPVQTLGFFGVDAGQTVLEITPGGGWYTEILAPLLRDGGTYIAAVVDPAKAANERAAEYYGNALKSYQEKLAGNAEVYGKAQVVQFDPANPAFGAPGSVDTVLTFRNVTTGCLRALHRPTSRASMTCFARAAPWVSSSTVLPKAPSRTAAVAMSPRPR